MAEQRETEWATIGKVVASFGVRGELKVRLLTDIPNRFTELEAIYAGPNHIRYRIAAARPYKGDMIILKLEGVEDANAAESLRNADLMIPVSELAKLPPDSYYRHDILGLQVATLGGDVLGNIVDILLTGGNDVYAVKTPAGSEILIPAIKEVIKRVDLTNRIMYIDPIRGLLDNNEAVYDEKEDE